MDRHAVNRNHTLEIKTEADIVFARMKVRQLASEVGLVPGNQARISLATSSLAHELSMGKTCQGQIAIHYLSETDPPGIQVVCRVDNGVSQERASRAAESVRWLVDELSVEVLRSGGGVQVALIRWREQ